MLLKFITYLVEQVKNCSIYIWGGQGQAHPIITEAWIKRVETSTLNAARAIRLWNNRVKEGYGEVLRAFDCSGLGTYFLYNLHRLIPTDKNSNGMKALCNEIKKADLKMGDWVFRTYKTGSKKGRAYHIGYIVDKQLSVVEAKGRDDGVVMRSLNASGARYWNWFGRPRMFEKEIETQPVPKEELILTRYLKYIRPYMRGEDVRTLQTLLSAAGHSPGSLDGIFGNNTRDAVKAFQKSQKLKADGIVGPDTARELNGTWQPGPDKTPITFNRLLKLTQPYLRGDDVRELQMALNELGYNAGKVDGVFGSNTHKAVFAFQRAKNIKVDGIVGAATSRELGATWAP